MYLIISCPILGTKIDNLEKEKIGGKLLPRKKSCKRKGKIPKTLEDNRRGVDGLNTCTEVSNYNHD